MPNVADTIQIAKYSSLLASLDLEKGSTNNPALVPNLPDILTIEGGILQWLNDIDPSNADLTKVANYVYSLCGSYGLTAQAIISGGGGFSNTRSAIIAAAAISIYSKRKFVYSNRGKCKGYYSVYWV